MTYLYHHEAAVEIAASAAVIFARLDDQAILGQHMERPSLMTMGMRMRYRLDAGQGRTVGSVIGMTGRMMCLDLAVEEVVTDREPPRLKTWETRGRPRLIVIGAYRMGFDVRPSANGNTLRVFIDYNRPSSWPGRLLGVLLGQAYARWCVQRMVDEAARHFSRSGQADG